MNLFKDILLHKKAKKVKKELLSKYKNESEDSEIIKNALNANTEIALRHITGATNNEFEKRLAKREYYKISALYDDFRNSPPVLFPQEENRL